MTGMAGHCRTKQEGTICKRRGAPGLGWDGVGTHARNSRRRVSKRARLLPSTMAYPTSRKERYVGGGTRDCDCKCNGHGIRQGPGAICDCEGECDCEPAQTQRLPMFARLRSAAWHSVLSWAAEGGQSAHPPGAVPESCANFDSEWRQLQSRSPSQCTRLAQRVRQDTPALKLCAQTQTRARPSSGARLRSASFCLAGQIGSALPATRCSTRFRQRDCTGQAADCTTGARWGTLGQAGGHAGRLERHSKGAHAHAIHTVDFPASARYHGGSLEAQQSCTWPNADSSTSSHRVLTLLAFPIAWPASVTLRLSAQAEPCHSPPLLGWRRRGRRQYANPGAGRLGLWETARQAKVAS